MTLMEQISRAHSLLDDGQPTKALEVLGPSCGHWPPTPDEDALMSALAEFYRGLAHRELNEGELALSCTRRALIVLQPERVRPGQSGALKSLASICADAGKIEYKWGRRQRTVELSQLVVAAYREADEAERATLGPQYALMTFDSGSIALNLSMPGVARSMFLEALGSFSASGDNTGVYSASLALAYCEEVMGNRTAALQFIHRAQALGESARDPVQLMYLMALTSLNDRDLEQARRVLEQLSELEGPESADATFARRVILWSCLLLREGRLDDAISMIRSTLDRVSDRSLKFEETGHLRLQLAMYLGDAGRLEEAIDEATQAMTLSKNNAYQELYAETAEFLGALYLISGDPAKAYDLCRAAVEAQPIRARFGNLGYGELARHGSSVPLGDRLLPISAAASGRPSDALLGLLRLRFDMREIIGHAKRVLAQRSFSSLFEAEYKALHLGIDLARSLDDVSITDDGDGLPAVIQKLEMGLAETFNESTRSDSYPGIAFDVAGAEGWLRSTQPDVAYVFLYSEGPRFLCLVTLAGTTTAIFLDEKVAELRQLTQAFWRDVHDIGLRGRTIIEALSARIWQPIQAFVTAGHRPLPRKIAFVPFGWTQLVPLHLLVEADGAALFTKYDIYRVPFADGPDPSPPSQPSRPGRLLFVAPFSADLPGTAREREAAGNFSLHMETLEGADCTGEKLATTLTRGSFDVIHFACHANVDYGEPALSYLQLWDRQRYYLADILRDITCPGATVFLSACESAVAAESSLNLRNSIAEAFHLGGARTVIGSQWPAEDAAAVDLAKHFYTHLADGMVPAAAFHASLRALGSRMLTAGLSYRYWAGWILTQTGHIPV
jgi:tetratricopeptide (TPR) repeat protein